MAGTTVQDGHGATIVFGTSSFTSEVVSIDWSGITRDPIDATHLGSVAPTASEFGGMEFIPPDLADSGELSVEIHTDPDKIPPVNLVAETITITFPKVPADTSATIWAGTGFVTGYSANITSGEKMTTTMIIKISGVVTVTVAT